MHIDYYVPFSVVAAAATGQVCSGVGGGREGREGGVSAGRQGGKEGEGEGGRERESIGGGTGRRVPLNREILTLILWALHGKNEVKSRWCPLPLGRSRSATSEGEGEGE